MQRWKKRLWTSSLVGAAVLLIIAAVLMGAVRLVDLAAPRYRQALANAITEAIEQPVNVGRIGMSWRGFRPTADLGDVVVLAPESRLPVFELREIHVPFRWTALLRGRFEPAEVILAGMALTLEWRADGSLGVQGIEMLSSEAESTDELDLADIISQLQQLGHVVIEDSELAWRDFGEPIGLTHLSDFNADLQLGDEVHSLSIAAMLPEHLGQSLALELALDGDLQQWQKLQARMDLRADALLIQGWLQPLLQAGLELRGGPARVYISSVWQGIQPQEVQLALESAPQTSWRGGQQLRELPGLSAALSLQSKEDGWQASIDSLRYQDKAGPGPVTRGSLNYQPQVGGFGDLLTGSLDVVRISDLLAWSSVLAESEALPVPAQAGGELEQLAFEYRQLPGQAPNLKLDAQLRHLSMPATDPLPGMAGINGKLSYAGDSIQMQLRSQGGQLVLPKLFRQPVPLDELNAQLSLQRTAEGWGLRSQALSLQSSTVTASGALGFDLFDDDRSPVIDLILDFSSTDVRPVKPLIPLPPALPEAVGDWLSAAILSGHVPAGEMVLRGALADFPYVGEKKTAGEFRIEFDVRDAELEYADGWPRVSKVDGRARFVGQSMLVQGRTGEILGVPVKNVRARIADFEKPLLKITGRVEAGLDRQLSFLAASPLHEDYQGLLESLKVSGPGRLDLELNLPLGDLEQTRISGDIQLQGAELRFVGLPHPITQVTGPLRFTEAGLSGEGIQGSFLGLPARAELHPEKTDDGAATRLDAMLTVKLPQDASRLKTLLGDAAPLQQFQGSTELKISSLFDSSGKTRPIDISSDLQGMAIALGAPFAKATTDNRALQVGITPANERLSVEWHYADAMHGRVELRSAEDSWQPLRGIVRLGAKPQSLALPAEAGWDISGDLPVLDLEGFSTGRGGDWPQLLNLDVHVGLLKVAGQNLRDIRLRLDPAQQSLQLTGPDSEGTVSWKQPNGRLLVDAKFKRLALDLPEQVADKEATGSEVASEPLDPASLPGIQLECEQFILGDEALGSLQLRTEPIQHGLRLNLLDIRGKRIVLRGSGEWLRVDGESSGQLLVNLNSDDIRHVLKASGYAESITANKADVFVDVSWSPQAEGLVMAGLNGKMGFELEEGSLLAVEPGAGRILSLLSFYSLPRRLSLDFSDVTGEGTAFDKLKGNFEIVDGNATTNNLKVESPSIEIKVKGRVGLAARDYDQTVVIEPELSSNIALFGAALGGPVMGLGLWLAQELLDQPFEQVATLTYHLGGSWDDPVIEPVRAESRGTRGGKPGSSKARSKEDAPPEPAAPESEPTSPTEPALTPAPGPRK